MLMDRSEGLSDLAVIHTSGQPHTQLGHWHYTKHFLYKITLNRSQVEEELTYFGLFYFLLSHLFRLADTYK